MLTTTTASHGHSGVICDVCKKADFKGLRFKCLVCFDFDVCENCRTVPPAINPTTGQRHAVHHPLQCIVLSTDYAKFYAGEEFDSSRPMSLTCPHCSNPGFETKELYEEHATPPVGSRVLCPACCGSAVGDPNMFYSNLANHLKSRHGCDTPSASPTARTTTARAAESSSREMAAAVPLSGLSVGDMRRLTRLAENADAARAARLPPLMDAQGPGEQTSAFSRRNRLNLSLTPFTPAATPNTSTGNDFQDFVARRAAALAAAGATAAAMADYRETNTTATIENSNPLVRGRSPSMPPLLSAHDSPNMMGSIRVPGSPPGFGSFTAYTAFPNNNRPIVGPVTLRRENPSRLPVPVTPAGGSNTATTSNNNTTRRSMRTPPRVRTNSPPGDLPSWAARVVASEHVASRTVDFPGISNTPRVFLPNSDDASARSSHSLHRSTTFDNRAALGGWGTNSGTSSDLVAMSTLRRTGAIRTGGGRLVNPSSYTPTAAEYFGFNAGGSDDPTTAWIFPPNPSTITTSGSPTGLAQGMEEMMLSSVGITGLRGDVTPATLLAHLQEAAMYGEHDRFDRALRNGGIEPFKPPPAPHFSTNNKAALDKQIKAYKKQMAEAAKQLAAEQEQPKDDEDDPRLLSNHLIKEMEQARANSVSEKDQVIRSLFVQELGYALLLGADKSALKTATKEQNEEQQGGGVDEAVIDDMKMLGLSSRASFEEGETVDHVQCAGQELKDKDGDAFESKELVTADTGHDNDQVGCDEIAGEDLEEADTAAENSVNSDDKVTGAAAEVLDAAGEKKEEPADQRSS